MHLQCKISDGNDFGGRRLNLSFIFISPGVVVFIIITIIIAITNNNTESTEMLRVKGKQPLAPSPLSPLAGNKIRKERRIQYLLGTRPKYGENGESSECTEWRERLRI